MNLFDLYRSKYATKSAVTTVKYDGMSFKLPGVLKDASDQCVLNTVATAVEDVKATFPKATTERGGSVTGNDKLPPKHCTALLGEYLSLSPTPAPAVVAPEAPPAVQPETPPAVTPEVPTPEPVNRLPKPGKSRKASEPVLEGTNGQA